MRNMKRKFSWFNLINGIFLTLVGAITIYPLWHELCLSFSRLELALRGGFFFWPRGFTAEAYKVILETGFIWQSYFNTAFITVVGTFLSLLVSCMLAYSLTKSDMPGCKLFSGIALFTMLFNGGIIPTFLLIKTLGLIDSLWSLILLNAVSAYNVFVIKSFFKSLPEEIEESACLDGCSPIRIFFQMILPLSKPVLATVGIWVAVAHWNDFMGPVMYLNSISKQTLSVLMRNIIAGQDMLKTMGEIVSSSTESVIAATIVLSILPIACVYPFLQKYFVKGVMIGSVKG